MSAKTKSMSLIKQLLRQHQQGKPVKFIARSLSISKNTVKAYLHRVRACALPIEQLLSLDDPELQGCLHPANPACTDARFACFSQRLPYFLGELKRVGVTRKLLWQEYCATTSPHPAYSYSQFCYHLDQHARAAKPTMVLTHQPAEKLFIDFAGSTLGYTDRITGQPVVCQVFVACLPYSDYGFAMAVHSQKVADVITALVCCLNTLGGVPQILVPDNFKAAVTKADAYEARINSALGELANHYGMSVLPARVGKPRDKALVENQVKLVYNRVYARLRDQQFFDLDSLNQAIAAKMHAHNHTRMQHKPYSRAERFNSGEKPALAALPAQAFELKHYYTSKVAQSGHIYLSQHKHHYSVPYQHIGAKVKVICTSTTVQIYAMATGKRIAVHPAASDYGYTTEKQHLCPAHQHYMQRSPDYYLQKAGAACPALHKLITAVFSQQQIPAEQLYRTCDGLFALQRKAGPEDFARACELASTHQQYTYSFVRNLLVNKMTSGEHDGASQPAKALPKHDNVRGKEYYAK